ARQELGSRLRYCSTLGHREPDQTGARGRVVLARRPLHFLRSRSDPDAFSLAPDQRREMSASIPIVLAPARESAPSAPPSLAARLTSLDVFRGLTIIGMLLVNNPGDAGAAYVELRHSTWNGWSLADLVFPFFLFVVGITTHLSLRGRTARGDGDGTVRQQILRRGAVIFAIGFLLNWFPFYQYGAIVGHPSPTFLDHVVGRLADVRILGVLQRIGLAYVAAALLTWKASTRRVVLTTGALLVGYWLLLTLVPVP